MSEFDPSGYDHSVSPDPSICLINLEKMFEVICKNTLNDQQGFYIEKNDRKIIATRTLHSTFYGIYRPEVLSVDPNKSQHRQAIVQLFGITRDIHGLHYCSCIEITGEPQDVDDSQEKIDVALAILLNGYADRLVEEAKTTEQRQSDDNIRYLYYLVF